MNQPAVQFLSQFLCLLRSRPLAPDGDRGDAAAPAPDGDRGDAAAPDRDRGDAAGAAGGVGAGGVRDRAAGGVRADGMAGAGARRRAGELEEGLRDVGTRELRVSPRVNKSTKRQLYFGPTKPYCHLNCNIAF
jgi:hypothetical protein